MKDTKDTRTEAQYRRAYNKIWKEQMKVKKGTTIPKKITDWLKSLNLATVKQRVKAYESKNKS